MQILNSGSFINLDNKEKIEQLIFTAKQVAHAAVETEGFVNADENNRQIALEIWQSAEYMCRDHEEANVKNIFVKNFLDQLRELKGAHTTPGGFLENARQENDNAFSDEGKPNSVYESVEPPKRSDEFLGFVANAESAGQGSDASVAAIGANEEFEQEFQSGERAADGDDAGENELTVNAESFAPAANNDAVTVEGETFAALPTSATIKASLEPENKVINEPNQTDLPGNSAADQAIDRNQSGAAQESAIAAIALPEKEPYQFDKCTVTATIQLLPTDAAAQTRKVVLSVRTHDFAPQISLVELQNSGGAEQVFPALVKAFDDYRNNLPVKVMDKLKKEKSTAKKQTSANKTAPAAANKIVAATNTVPAAPNANVSAQTAINAAINGSAQIKSVADKIGEASKTASSTSSAASFSSNASGKKTNSPSSKTGDGLQGSLFGF